MSDLAKIDCEDSYEILSMLGEGSRAKVYLAADKKQTGKRVAIKFLREDSYPELEMGNAHLSYESQILSICSHENVLAVLETGKSSSGRIYMVTEYLGGKTLREIISRGPLGISDIGSIFIPLTGALENMHKVGVSHLDLRPDKIIIQDGEAGPQPKILGFGRAKFLPWGGREQNIEPPPKAGIYSCQYSSPEQVLDKRCLPASDVYSLGCILYEAVSGRPAFHGENELHTLAQHLSANVPPPSEVRGDSSLRKLDEVIMQSIARETHMRFVDTAELREALMQQLPSKQTGSWLKRIFKK